MKETLNRASVLAALKKSGHHIQAAISPVQYRMHYNGSDYFLILLEKTNIGDYEMLMRQEHSVDERHLVAATGYQMPAIIIVIELLNQRVLRVPVNHLSLRKEAIKGCPVFYFARRELEDITVQIQDGAVSFPTNIV